MLTCFLFGAWGCALLPGSPQTAVEAALADARQLPATLAHDTRYLSLYHYPRGDLDQAWRVLAFHVNSLSREAKIVVPRRVTADLVAIRLSDYGWPASTFGKAGQHDPFFHRWSDGQLSHAPWLHAPSITELSQRLNSFYPVLRADWFLVRTAQQQDRQGDGYYDFLGVRTVADFEALVGFDRKAAQRKKREVAAIVRRSGGSKTKPVTLHNRQIFQFDLIGGHWWETRDAATNTGPANALRQLDGDFRYEASEIYAHLPNDLFAYALSARGVALLQATAPDFIAHAQQELDGRVHVMVSCVKCHKEGLRPIDDWGRKVLRSPLGLQSPDLPTLRRLEQLYLSTDFDDLLEEGRSRFAKAVRRCNGWTPSENATAYAQFWDRYVVADRDLAACAAELGTTTARLQRALRQSAKRRGTIDAVLAGLLLDPVEGIEASQWEEVYPLAQTLLQEEDR